MEKTIKRALTPYMKGDKSKQEVLLNNPKDKVYTPDEVAKEIITKIDNKFHISGTILDPCKGKGAFYNNYPSHLQKDWCEIDEGKDFLELDETKHYDWIISNPPYSCYSADTEVLTNNGWKCFKDVDIDKDLIYSYNPDSNNIELVKAIHKIKRFHKGDMYHFYSNNMDIFVSDDHNMIAYTNSIYNGFIKAKDIKSHHHLKRDGFNYKGNKIKEFILPSCNQKEQYSLKEITIPEKPININNWLEFFGFYLGDGCYRDHKNNNGRSLDYTISIKQSIKNEKYVVNLFRNIGFEPKIYNNKDGKANYCVYSKQLWLYLKQFGRSDEKFIPRWILNLDKSHLYYLYKGYTNADSYKLKNDFICLNSISKKLIENFQEIILKLFGSITQIRIVRTYKSQSNNKYLYSITYSKQNSNHYYNYKNKKILHNYNDYIYCLTLEKYHTMLIRRNNKINWCGNCYNVFNDKAMKIADNIVWLIPINKLSSSGKRVADLSKWGGVPYILLCTGPECKFNFGFSIGAVYYKKGYKDKTIQIDYSENFKKMYKIDE